MTIAYGLRTERIELSLPLWRYAAMKADRPFTVLLDSQANAASSLATTPPPAHAHASAARFSYLVWDPFLVFSAQRIRHSAAGHENADQPPVPERALVRILEGRPINAADSHHNLVAQPYCGFRRLREYTADPFEELRSLLAQYTLPREIRNQCKLPFANGAVGYFGYEAGHFIEPLAQHPAQQNAPESLHWPAISFGFYDSVLAYDHHTRETFLSILERGADRESAHHEANARRSRLLEELETFGRSLERVSELPPPMWESAGTEPGAADAQPEPRSNLTAMNCGRAVYTERVRELQQHILQGNLFEGCLTHRFVSPYLGSPFEFYRTLRRINPSSFGAFLTMPQGTAACSSPEQFVQLDAQGAVISRPIKGTRPRGASALDDMQLAFELLHSEKDRAENLMIVDLVRNDLGRVCELGSVQATEICVLESHPSVHHLVSTVRGQLEVGKTAIDLVRAAFPGGSMTGAPKIAAMDHVANLEPDERGLYSGSIGYIDFGGALDLNIVIRTAILQNANAYYHAGGAIVSDSDPDSEYDETLHKVAAIQRVLGELDARAQRPPRLSQIPESLERQVKNRESGLP